MELFLKISFYAANEDYLKLSSGPKNIYDSQTINPDMLL